MRRSPSPTAMSSSADSAGCHRSTRRHRAPPLRGIPADGGRGHSRYPRWDRPLATALRDPTAAGRDRGGRSPDRLQGAHRVNIPPRFEQQLAAWLEDGPVDAPDETLEHILDSFPSLPQRRGALRVPWRSAPMSAFSRGLIGIAALVAIAASVLFVVPRLQPGGVGGQPSPIPTTPAVAPSATEATSAPSAHRRRQPRRRRLPRHRLQRNRRRQPRHRLQRNHRRRRPRSNRPSRARGTISMPR